MRIAIMGSGGVGGYFGSRLVQAGQDVTFIARGAHLNALKQTGIRLISVKGDFAGPVQATDDPETVGTVDLVLVGTKAWQVADAGKAMLPMIGPATAVLPLQNGVEAAEELIKVVGAKPVLGGLCRIISYRSQPGEITHMGADPTIVFGELDGSETARCKWIANTFNAAVGVEAEPTQNIRVALWQKFLFMPPVSSVGAVTRAPLGVIRQVPETRELLVAAIQEVKCLAEASDVALPASAVDATMSFIDGLPANTTASMQRDITDGKPSELESQTGAVVRLAGKLGVPVPVHSHLYQALLPLELRARGTIKFPE